MKAKYLGTGTITVEGQERTIFLTRIDIKNKAFAGVIKVLGSNIEIRNTQENNVTLDDIKNIKIDFERA